MAKSCTSWGLIVPQAHLSTKDVPSSDEKLLAVLLASVSSAASLCLMPPFLLFFLMAHQVCPWLKQKTWSSGRKQNCKAEDNVWLEKRNSFMLQTPLAYCTVGKSNSAGASTQLSATQKHGCLCCSSKKGPTKMLAGCYLGTLCYLDILPKRKCCRGLVPFQNVA